MVELPHEGVNFSIGDDSVDSQCLKVYNPGSVLVLGKLEQEQVGVQHPAQNYLLFRGRSFRNQFWSRHDVSSENWFLVPCVFLGAVFRGV
jgi:hypothetical protein